METVYVNQSRSSKYGITERKKAELDALTAKVLNAEDDVEKLQAIVTSLTQKSENFQTQLTAATNNREKALSNLELLNEVTSNIRDLKNNSRITFDEIVLADARIKGVAQEIKAVMEKLIYTAEVIQKLANLVIRKKALNPLISDELVTMVNTAGADANNAVALTLVALNSVFAAQATSIESEANLSLEYLQAIKLFELFTGNEAKVDEIDYVLPPNNITNLITDAYEAAKQAYKEILIASKDTTKQLNTANENLNVATVRLNSLQSGLAAANAAALAS